MKIPKRIASVIINSLKGGVVPRIGLPYITVGRENEIDAFLNDIEIIGEGGAAFRFIVGKYGSGKSFLLQTVRSYAMDKNMVVADADLSPERRLQGTRGQGLATYKELIRNMSTKTRPEGGALTLILDRWISGLQTEVMNENSLGIDDDRIPALTERKISEVISSLNEMVHGFDFARLLTVYYKAYLNGDDESKARVVKWFRGEYTTKTEAKAELGVNIIIEADGLLERAAAHGNMPNDERAESQGFDTVEAQAEMGGGWGNITVDALYLAADIAMIGEPDNNDKQKLKVVRERKRGQKKKQIQDSHDDGGMRMNM